MAILIEIEAYNGAMVLSCHERRCPRTLAAQYGGGSSITKTGAPTVCALAMISDPDIWRAAQLLINLSGRMSALAWVTGAEWAESLDT